MKKILKIIAGSLLTLIAAWSMFCFIWFFVGVLKEIIDYNKANNVGIGFMDAVQYCMNVGIYFFYSAVLGFIGGTLLAGGLKKERGHDGYGGVTEKSDFDEFTESIIAADIVDADDNDDSE